MARRIQLQTFSCRIPRWSKNQTRSGTALKSTLSASAETGANSRTQNPHGRYSSGTLRHSDLILTSICRVMFSRRSEAASEITPASSAISFSLAGSAVGSIMRAIVPARHKEKPEAVWPPAFARVTGNRQLRSRPCRPCRACRRPFHHRRQQGRRPFRGARRPELQWTGSGQRWTPRSAMQSG